MSLFGTVTPPSFVKYNPDIRHLEVYEEEIFVTADQPMPLVKFNLRDRGGILTYEQIKTICEKCNKFFPAGMNGGNFVFIKGRTDSVRLLANIYIEDIQYCIENSQFRNKLTGFFKYGLVKNKDKNSLRIIIYLNDQDLLTQSEKNKFQAEFKNNLTKVNKDFEMVSKGIDFNFLFEFTKEPEDKYKKNSKFRYVL